MGKPGARNKEAMAKEKVLADRPAISTPDNRFGFPGVNPLKAARCDEDGLRRAKFPDTLRLSPVPPPCQNPGRLHADGGRRRKSPANPRPASQRQKPHGRVSLGTRLVRPCVQFDRAAGCRDGIHRRTVEPVEVTRWDMGEFFPPNPGDRGYSNNPLSAMAA